MNFHRPCYFAVDTIDAKGKIKKTYPRAQIMTFWERLQSIENYRMHRQPDVTPESLEHFVHTQSDNASAKQVQEARKRLFQSFNRRSKVTA